MTSRVAPMTRSHREPARSPLAARTPPAPLRSPAAAAGTSIADARQRSAPAAIPAADGGTRLAFADAASTTYMLDFDAGGHS